MRRRVCSRAMVQSSAEFEKRASIMSVALLMTIPRSRRALYKSGDGLSAPWKTAEAESGDNYGDKTRTRRRQKK